jgi:putative ABC transport system permease protein
VSSPAAWFRRFTGLFGRSRKDAELHLELEAHVAMHVDDNIRAGMSPEEARRDALIRLGGLEQTKLNVRDRRGVPGLETLAQDIRYGARALRKSPGFTVVAVATLALGVGANSAVFSVVNAVLLRPLPFREPDRIVTFRQNIKGADDHESLPDLEDIHAHSRSFASIGGISKRPLDLTGRDAPVQITAGLCSAGYFGVFGVRPERGRLITPEDDREKFGRVVVISREFWTAMLGADPDAMGKTLELSGHRYTIVGILPGGLRLPGRPVDLWTSLTAVDPGGAAERDLHILATYARLAPGATLGSARAELTGIDRWLERQYPEENRGRRRDLVPLRESLVSDSRRTLLILFGAVGFVLLIACTNFASLLLARASAREREMAIRGALGAGSRRLVRQLLTESILLALLGGLAGLGLAHLGVKALLALQPGNADRLLPVRIDRVVFAFTAAMSALTGLLFGLIPALSASRVDLNRGLREGGRAATGTRRHLRLRRSLVISEIAIALVLLAGAGLLVRSFWKLKSVEPGFRSDHVLTMRLELPEVRYETLAQQRLFRRRLLDSVGALPGTRAAIVSELPMSGDALTHNFIIEGRPRVAVGEEPEVLTRTVSEGYFRALQIPFRRGRGFGIGDREDSPLVAIVNDSFARRYFPGADPVGARIRWANEDTPQWMTVVGVVGDVNHFGPALPEEPAVYDLYEQTPQRWKRWMYLVVRSPIAESALVAEVGGRIHALDKQLPLTKVRPMNEVVAGSTDTEKFNVILLSIFAGLALTLASIGIYGLIAYSVTQQKHDIGIRMALGARGGDILRMVVGDAGRLAAAGVGIGITGALALTRIMSSLLFGVGARDPGTLGGVVAILAGVVALASYIPARWATRVDPAVSLRVD